METPFVADAIQDYLVEGQPHAMTSMIWNALLATYFPSSDGYFTGLEMQIGNGRADLFTAHVVHKAKESVGKFLVVECKSSGHETEGGMLEAGTDQLERYLRAINAPGLGPLRNKHVRFYELVDDTLVDLDGDGEIYMLDRQCQSVVGKLNYLRDNHLSI